MRYERKYRIENYESTAVKQVLLENPAFFKTAYADRYVNSLYLDNPSRESLQDNLGGIARRTKYRIRWYGDLKEARNPVLEKKQKKNMLGWKDLKELPSFSLSAEDSLMDFLRAQLPDYPELEPVLLVRYLRSYYEGRSGVRATIDRKQEFYPVFRDGMIPEYGIKDPAVILEIKYGHADEHLLDSVFQAIPFRLSKNSKFANGLFLVYL